jgi:hypothetical protein
VKLAPSYTQRWMAALGKENRKIAVAANVRNPPEMLVVSKN